MMANLDKDIAETRDTLVKHINNLTLNYSQLLHERTNIESNKNSEILLLNNQNRLQLQEIQTLNDEISAFNKKCYDYEVIINEYQKKMVEVESDREQRDRVSIMKTQADELHKKDQYIEQLQGKIKFLQSDKQNISLKFIDANLGESDAELEPMKEEDIDKSGGWSPTTSNSPVQVETTDKTVDMNIVNDNVGDNESVDIVNDIISDNESVDIEYKRIKYKGEKYYIIVGEEPQIVYKILEDDDVGDRVGIRKKKTKGKGYDIDFD